MNEIAHKPQITTPAVSHPILARALDVVLSGAVTTGGVTVLLPGKELSPEARRMAEGRLSTLSRSLDARDRQAVTLAISQMLGGFPSIRQTGDEARALLSAYVMLVEEFPPWAVTEACRRWASDAKAEGRTLAFPPSAAELREVAERTVNRFMVERARLIQALSARPQPVSEAEKSRVSEGFDAIRAELRAASPAKQKRHMSPDEAKAALGRRCIELGVDPGEVERTKDQPNTFRHFDFKDLPF